MPPMCEGVPTNTIATVELGAAPGTTVTWQPPRCVDLSPTTETSSASPGDFFLIGVTTVTFTCLDSSGNLFNCPFDVTVLEGNFCLSVRMICEFQDVEGCTKERLFVPF